MSNIIPIQSNMIPLRDASTVEEDRVFYELSYKINTHKAEYENNWIRTGNFKEVDIARFSKDGDISNVDYLEHHNFMVIKGK